MVVAILALVGTVVSAIAGGKKSQADKALQDDAILASYRQMAFADMAQKVDFIKSGNEGDDKTFRYLIIGGVIMVSLLFLATKGK